MALNRFIRWLVVALLLPLMVVCVRKPTIQIQPAMETPQSHYQMGKELLQGDNVEEAANHFQAALVLDQQYAPALEGLGLVSLKQGALAEAESYFRQGLDEDESYAPLYTGLGRLQAQRGLDEEAIQLYQKAIQLDPQGADSFYFMGLSYKNIGQYSLAEESFKKTLDRNPGHAEARRDWAELAESRSSSEDLSPEYVVIVKKAVVNRADFAALLAHQIPLEQICGSGKTNVQPNDIVGNWAREEIEEIISCGIMDSYDDGTFRPREPISRRDAALILQKICLKKTIEEGSGSQIRELISTFPDVSTGDEALPAIVLVTSLGIMESRKDGNFGPDEELNGHSAMRITRTLKEKLWVTDHPTEGERDDQ